MRAVCRSIAAHTISCSGWSATLEGEDLGEARPVPELLQNIRKRTL
ncbi:Hypothetical protein SCLAV_1665 [Streptomyces clavuligerus]|uniref:Uncharacterized protein n=1 Tax=Streptomyces clavuligerus TaxID=1901 RepID=B5GQH9_STRCL|nr:hypothetical protein SSCG_01603 [Streptomyces clavuligerus]EFG06740.1 Hypothetical protein SCLAV_1665 [Streptomyces clavuligerus]